MFLLFQNLDKDHYQEKKKYEAMPHKPFVKIGCNFTTIIDYFMFVENKDDVSFLVAVKVK